jgi:hypothetical protein
VTWLVEHHSAGHGAAFGAAPDFSTRFALLAQAIRRGDEEAASRALDPLLAGDDGARAGLLIAAGLLVRHPELAAVHAGELWSLLGERDELPLWASIVDFWAGLVLRTRPQRTDPGRDGVTR